MWLLFKYSYTNFTEVVRQNDKMFVDLLNKEPVGNIYDDVEKLLKAGDIHESDETLHIYAENEPTMKRNYAVLNNFPGEF